MRDRRCEKTRARERERERETEKEGGRENKLLELFAGGISQRVPQNSCHVDSPYLGSRSRGRARGKRDRRPGASCSIPRSPCGWAPSARKGCRKGSRGAPPRSNLQQKEKRSFAI